MLLVESEVMPHGEHPLDCDFQIGQVTTAHNGKLYGIIWYSGGEAWCWSDYEVALRAARRMAEERALRS